MFVTNYVKRVVRDFPQVNIWTKILLVFSAVYFSVLFIENFIFSSSFATLSLREIDDTAFQHSIRKIHEAISSFKVDKLLKLNDYGYGWIFWIITGIITYPFYLLALLTDFHVPLIVAPRDISLAFTIGTLFFVYKSLSVYSKDHFFRFIACLLLFTFPAFGYFSLRFGTVSQVMFFSSVTFYLAVSKDSYSKKDLRNIAIAAAACVGTKINGAFIMPLIGLIMADRLHWNINKDTIKKFGYFFLFFLFFFVLFSNPSLFLAPFKHSYFHSYMKIMKSNSHLSVQDNSFSILQDVLRVGYLNFYFAVIAIIFMVLLGVLDRESKRKDFLYIAIWLVISLVLLSKVMEMGSLYIVNYILVVMYLLVLAILFLEKLGQVGRVISVIFVVGSFYVNYTSISSGYYDNLKYFKSLQKPRIVGLISSNQVIQDMIPDPKMNEERKVNVLVDHRAIFPYSHFDRDNVNIIFSFDNLKVSQTRIKGSFDYIALNKKSPTLLTDEEFDVFLGKIKSELHKTNLQDSRQIMSELLETGKMGDAEYEVMVDNDYIIFLQKK